MNPSTLSNEALNRLIHEQVMKECWHEYINSNRCQKCFNINTTEYNTDNPSYCTSWEDYGPMLEKLKNHRRWGDFTYSLYKEWMLSVDNATKQNKANEFYKFAYLVMFEHLLTPAKGCKVIAEYFCKEG